MLQQNCFFFSFLDCLAKLFLLYMQINSSRWERYFNYHLSLREFFLFKYLSLSLSWLNKLIFFLLRLVLATCSDTTQPNNNKKNVSYNHSILFIFLLLVMRRIVLEVLINCMRSKTTSTTTTKKTANHSRLLDVFLLFLFPEIMRVRNN